MIVIINHSIALCIKESEQFKGFSPISCVRFRKKLWVLKIIKKDEIKELPKRSYD